MIGTWQVDRMEFGGAQFDGSHSNQERCSRIESTVYWFGCLACFSLSLPIPCQAGA